MYLGLAATKNQPAKVLTPDWADAHFMKGYALLELGHISEARAQLERAVALSPNNAQYQAELGYTYEIEKNWAKALPLYEAAEDAAEFSPDDAKVGELGRALRGQGYVSG
jgi:Flp pilus assembly protein TadD